MKKKSAKNKRESFEITDGKNRDLATISKLEKLINVGIANPYGTLNKEIFADKVEGMLLGELQDLAKRVGLVPQNRSDKLREQLIKNFHEFLSTNVVGVAGQKRGGMSMDDPNYAKAMRLIAGEKE